MAELILFHHAQGLTPGVLTFAEELAATVDEAELFLYPGDRHLFTDSSLPAYDEAAARLVRERVTAFLDGLPEPV
ncbi:MAG TPA: dienelactone hydrolase family protein [Solirubrobacteraceae bacterium]